MNLGLKNRVALVTGSNQGLGKVIALTLAREECNLIICGRDEEKLIATSREIQNKYKVWVKYFRLDVLESNSIENMFETTVAKIGSLDILVNNIGGVREFLQFHDLNDDHFRKSFELNYMSAVRFSRESMSYLKKSDNPRIINIGTVPAHQPSWYNPHYISAKAALLNLNKYLSNICGKDNILVNAVCPSSVLGNAWDRSVKDKAQRESISVLDAEEIMKKEVISKIPLGRMGHPEEVAELVIFLASSKSGFITGQCIDVDGGLTKSI